MIYCLTWLIKVASNFSRIVLNIYFFVLMFQSPDVSCFCEEIMVLAMSFLGKKELKSFGVPDSSSAQPDEHGWNVR